MLMKKNELYSVFNSPSGQPKSIVCACVDGARMRDQLMKRFNFLDSGVSTLNSFTDGVKIK